MPKSGFSRWNSPGRSTRIDFLRYRWMIIAARVIVCEISVAVAEPAIPSFGNGP